MTHEELLSKWEPTIKRSDHIFTWTERLTLAWLAEHASTTEFAVEIGVYMGRSAKVMLDAGCHHLWAVDPFMVDGTFECTKYFLNDDIAKGRCEIVRKFTMAAAVQLQHVKEQISFVFVDDGHAFNDVVTDISSFLPLLKPGCIICGHDYETSPENDVAKAVRQILPGHTEPVPRLWCYVRP